MKVIHVGLGTKGRRWLEAVHSHAGLSSAACVDPEASALDWTKRRFADLRDSCYATLDEALDKVRADAAIIASPSSLHVPQAVAALDAGLAVMIARPFATTTADAARVLEASRRTGRVAMAAATGRYGRREQTLKHLLREGRVGTITHASLIDRRSRAAPGDGLAGTRYVQLIEAAADHFDSLRSILGVNPVSVTARSTTAPWSDYAHGSTTEAVLEMERDIHVQYYGSLTSTRTECSLWIEGSGGVLQSDRSRTWWRKRGWRFFMPVRSRKIPAGDALGSGREGTATLLEQLKAAAIDGRVPETSGADNLWSLSMVEAAVLSDTNRRSVQIGELLAGAGLPPSPPAGAQR